MKRKIHIIPIIKGGLLAGLFVEKTDLVDLEFDVETLNLDYPDSNGDEEYEADKPLRDLVASGEYEDVDVPLGGL